MKGGAAPTFSGSIPAASTKAYRAKKVRQLALWRSGMVVRRSVMLTFKMFLKMKKSTTKWTGNNLGESWNKDD